MVLENTRNQFCGRQGTGDKGEISQFHELNYELSFPLFRKSQGQHTAPRCSSAILKARAGPEAAKGVRVEYQF